LILGRTAAEKSKYSEIIQIFRKNPKIPVYSFDILNNPFRKILLIFPKKSENSTYIPKNPQYSLKSSKILKILENPQKSSKFPKILKIPKNSQNSQKSSKIPKILKNPLIFPKILKTPKNPQKSTKF
jgi:hypothetical protein